MMKIVKRLIAFLVLAATASAFLFPQAAVYAKHFLSVQPSFTWGFLAVLLLTPLCGRFFCECLCPLGIVQSFLNWLFHPKSHVRRVCTRLPDSLAQKIVRSVVIVAFIVLSSAGFGALAHLITPYSIVGKALSLFVPGVVVFAVVALLAVLGRGRIWCNWVCPAGTLFTLLSRWTLAKHKVGSGCAACRKCFANKSPSQESHLEPGVTRREAMRGVALLAAVKAAEKTVDGGYAPVSIPSDPNRLRPIMPPGAVSRAEFNLKCVGCGLCVKACPAKVIRQSMSLKTFGQPELYFANGYCHIACNYKCASVCPAGALKARSSDRRHLHMGHAIWKKDLCIRTVDGVDCTACVRNCPVKALNIVGGTLQVDKASCIGCGACEHVCPARPQSAVIVKGFDNQREVVPMGEGDLILAMKDLLGKGERCVLAKGGVIFAKSSERGVKPLVDFLKSGKLKGALVVDKVIGKAAAALCVVGGARKVHGLVMTDAAKALLLAHGVEASADKMAERILNRSKTGLCPMETRVKDLSDIDAMVQALVSD